NWTGPASTLLPLYSGVQALNFVDADWVIRVVYPAATNQAALNISLRNNVNVSVIEALGKAERTAMVTRTDIVELLQSGKGFAFYKQIQASDGRRLGFVNGVFRIRDLMDSCLSEEPLRQNFEFGLFEKNQLLYQQPASLIALQSPFLVNVPVDLTGQSWRLAFAPLPSHLESTSSPVDEIWIALGILLTFLLAFATRSLLIKQRVLKENEDKYRLLVENQTDMLVKVNMDGEFQYVSPSYCNCFGKTEKELLGKQFLPLVNEQDREHTNKSLASLIHPPYTSYHEQRAMTKEGWRWLAWSNTAVLNKKGEIEAITAVGRDVTEIKSLEENIAHSQKMKALGEMAGSITHDFNNLLQVIIGNVEYMLHEGNHTAATQESLHQVSKVVERAMSLTQKLSTLSRQEMTRRTVFPVNGFLQDFMAFLKHTLPASISLNLAQSDDRLHVYADKSLLEQVLLNICFNARDAIESNGTINIQTSKKVLDKKFLRQRPGVEPGDYVLITIEDDGCGMSPETIARVFDPFFTTKPAGTGTGLGLANCYTIIKQHNGMILVDSHPGSGTCLSVLLPLAEPGVAAPVTARPSPVKNTAVRKNLILVADDDAAILKLTRMTLESAGFETLAAKDGKEALELFYQYEHEIGLIVLDLVMPETGGQEVAEKIRAHNDNVKILFVTGYIPESTTANLEEPVLRKPYKRSLFLETIAKILAE
ncbi:MAG: PAS domain S-box protein, partial [Gammaproteobacteria bacterium]|nr:PAS domain S-box protein [Gammaproteobacteria bacterium]